MKKVAIITITNSGLNYGNRLQNFALQEKLKQYGVQVETIYSANVCKNSLLLSKLRRKVKKIVKTSKRRRYFNKFNRLYIISAKKVHYGKLNEADFSQQYDAFIAGSDQIWNPNFHFNTDFEFLTFTDPKKRYSYAASLGVDFIPETDKENYKKWLRQMERISVREYSGQALIKKLLGKESLVHIDPTMLLDKEEYIKIEEKPNQELPSRYLLTYYLGTVSVEYRNFINQIAKMEQLEIVELSELPDTRFYHMGPQHYLYLFHHAEYVCTDSFHGTVFSILFEKRFTVFCRQDHEVPMNARIDTVLNKMNLCDRLFGKLSVEDSRNQIDYKEVRRWLELERSESESYLKEISSLW